MSQDISKPKTLTISNPLNLDKEDQLSTLTKKSVIEAEPLDPKPSSLTSKQKDQSPKAAQQEAQKKRNGGINRVLRWLCERYPNCFNLKDPKPLKICIHKDISEAMKAGTDSDQPSNIDIRSTLHFYTRNLPYHRAVLNNSHRIDLKGDPVEEITPEAGTYAQERIEVLELWKQKQREKKKKSE